MLLKITYLLMRWTFGLAVLMFRGDQSKNAELLVLRHENAVLRRIVRHIKTVTGGSAGRISPEYDGGYRLLHPDKPPPGGA